MGAQNKPAQIVVARGGGVVPSAGRLLAAGCWPPAAGGLPTDGDGFQHVSNRRARAGREHPVRMSAQSKAQIGRPSGLDGDKWPGKALLRFSPAGRRVRFGRGALDARGTRVRADNRTRLMMSRRALVRKPSSG